jgi:Flp pilus assembly protein TadG
MNRCISLRHTQRIFTHRSFGPGQSVVELAVAVTVLVMLLLAGADFARIFATWIELNGAARAAAQYGSQSIITAADTSGMIAAAETDNSNITGLTVTASQCTCESSQSVTACSSSYCSDNSTATYVIVDTQATFHTLVNYPGMPSSVTLSGQAVMQVQQ